MVFLLLTRNKMFFTRETSRNLKKFLSVKNYHSPTSDKKSILRFSSYLKSRWNPLLNHSFKHSSFSVNCYRATFKDIHRESSTLADVENAPLNNSRFEYTEHPDVTNRSQEEIENFYKLKSISIKGTDVPKPIMKFSEFCLPENLTKVLKEENYLEPTPIQCQGWPIALSCRDMVGVSQTGSGKTLAYMLPAIVHATRRASFSLKKNKHYDHKPKVLVLGPTRELVQQIYGVSKRYLRASNLHGACVYGGASKLVQLHNLEGAEICVATPGRLLDFLQSREVSLKECSYLVLDEADRMLDMGFEPQIRQIIDQISCERQTLMWSATWPKDIRNLAEDFLSDYVRVTVGNAELVANPNIQQHIYIMREEEKYNRLISFLKSTLDKEQCKMLVFAQTKKRVDYLCNLLHRERIPAGGIHGNFSQRQRDDVLHRFKKTTPFVLIATDVASRGLDISDIQHIVNLDLPTNIEDYIHRIGRTARGSACGEAHSFFTSENSVILEDLISVLKQSNQPVDPKLYTLQTPSMEKPSFRFQRKPSHNKSFGNKRMYRYRDVDRDMY